MQESSYIFIALVVFNVFVASIAQILLKKAALKTYPNVYREFLNVLVISGYALMVLSMLSNIYAMSQGVLIQQVSIIESLSYLFVPLFSYFFFKEKLSANKIFSIVLIIVGVIVFFL